MFFSVVIPTYNRATFISKAIESVIHQTYTDWELIVINDGSTDNTKEVITSFTDERIKYFYQQNAERSAARNNGISKATGEWICFLDSDDEYLSDHLHKLSVLISEIQHKPALLCTGLIRRSPENEDRKPFLNLEKDKLTELSTKFLIPTQVCIHRSILQDNQFDKRFRLWEDTHLWLRIAANYPIFQIEKYTCIQNVHEQSTVQQGMKQVKLKEIEQYIFAIKDLQNHYSELFRNKFTDAQFKNYVDSKYRMYLYQARQNKQASISSKVWLKAMLNKPSLYLLSEFPKIFMNKLGFGLHGK